MLGIVPSSGLLLVNKTDWGLSWDLQAGRVRQASTVLNDKKVYQRNTQGCVTDGPGLMGTQQSPSKDWRRRVGLARGQRGTMEP